MKRSEIARELFGEAFVRSFRSARANGSGASSSDAVSDWDIKRYFSICHLSDRRMSIARFAFPTAIPFRARARVALVAAHLGRRRVAAAAKSSPIAAFPGWPLLARFTRTRLAGRSGLAPGSVRVRRVVTGEPGKVAKSSRGWVLIESHAARCS
jgi:hypothetical protein